MELHKQAECRRGLVQQRWKGQQIKWYFGKVFDIEMEVRMESIKGKLRQSRGPGGAALGKSLRFQNHIPVWGHRF